MTAGETAGACIAAAVGICLIASWAFDLWHRPRTIRRFQQTARHAARPEAHVRADLVAGKEAAEDLAACIAIWDLTHHDTPHQRTEEDR